VSISSPAEGAIRTRADSTHAFIPRSQRGLGERGLALTRDERIDDRALDIANRLRFACAELPPEELLALALQMAAVELKYLDRVGAEDRR
jgi:hypothetical protein